jgi:NifU-like protein involved in Fe-S cluster formation
MGENSVYGPIAADHLKRPRNLGKIERPDGIGHVEEPATDTQVTVYLRFAPDEDGQALVRRPVSPPSE